jgi:hypothetical protein
MTEWLTTRSSGKSHTCSADDGVTGWRLHAVAVSAKASFEEVGRTPALVG